MNSKYFVNNEELFNNLTIEIYKHTYLDKILICEDFNARIEEKVDVLDESMIPKRIVIDHATNPQGEKLVSFVNDIKGCVVNGRMEPNRDDYTSVASHKGLAVVDYFICRQDDFKSLAWKS